MAHDPNQYYPAGNFGPVCDPIVPPAPPVEAVADEEDDFTPVYPSDFNPEPDIPDNPDGFDGGPPIVNITATPSKLPPVDDFTPEPPRPLEELPEVDGLYIRDVNIAGPNNIVPNTLQRFSAQAPRSDIDAADLNYEWAVTDISGNIVDPFPIEDTQKDGDLTVQLRANRAIAPIGTKVTLSWSSGSSNATTKAYEALRPNVDRFPPDYVDIDWRLVDANGPAWNPNTNYQDDDIVIIGGSDTTLVGFTGPQFNPQTTNGTQDVVIGANVQKYTITVTDGNRTATASATVQGVGAPSQADPGEDRDPGDPIITGDGVTIGSPLNQGTSLTFPGCGPYSIAVIVSSPDALDSPQRASTTINCVDRQDDAPESPDPIFPDLPPYNSIICYDSPNADVVDRSDFGATSPVDGCHIVKPLEDTVYCITMSNEFGTTTACAGVSVGLDGKFPDGWPGFPDIDPCFSMVTGLKCKDKYKAGELDCEFTWTQCRDDDIDRWNECLDPDGDCYPWKDAIDKIGEFDPRIDPPDMKRNNCFNFNPDINITPFRRFDNTGKEIVGQPIKASEPLTYPVTSLTGVDVTVNDLCVGFSPDGNSLIATGEGEGIIGMTFEWDDNPRTASTALIGGGKQKITFSQGNSEEGSDTETLYNLSVGTYEIIIESKGGNRRLRDNDQTIQFDDDNGSFDINAELKILSSGTTATAKFDKDYNLKVTSAGNVRFRFEWDDNPRTNGQAIDKIIINASTTGDQNFSIPGVQIIRSDNTTKNGVTFTQTGKETGKVSKQLKIPGPGTYPIVWNELNPANVPFKNKQKRDPFTCEGRGTPKVLEFDRGNQEEFESAGVISVPPGTYPTTITGNDGGFVRQNNNKKICFYDTDGTDCNGILKITDGSATFKSNGDLEVTGTGTQIIQFKFEVDDNIKTKGTGIQKVVLGQRGTASNIRMYPFDGNDSVRTTDNNGVWNGKKVRNEAGGKFWPKKFEKKGDEMVGPTQTFTVTKQGVTVTFSVYPVYRVSNDDDRASDIDSVWWINSWAGSLPPAGTEWKYTFTPTNQYSNNAQRDITVRFQTFGGGGDEEELYKKLCLYDSHSDDCNAELSITNGLLQTTFEATSLWTDEGNDLAVWVNPEICTLPDEVQEVIYRIDIPTKGDYEFVWAADFKCLDVTWDVDPQDYTGGQVIFENKKQGMVKAGIATPYRIVLSDLKAKEYTMKVRVKNDSGGYIKKNTGEYKDQAYDWRKNPGGWYMKICFGGKCDDFTNSITWKRAGPHFRWAGYSFLNDFAVIPELDPDIGTTHTETWTFVVPESTNYQLQTAMDNTGTILLQKFNAGNWNTVKTVTNSGLSGNTQQFFLKEGLYRIQASVTNASNNIPLKHETWDNNPAGIAFNLTRVAELSSISATLDSNANLVVTGTGRAEIKMELVYDDNPKTEGTGLGTYKVAGMKFVRDLKKEKGDFTASSIVTPQTYRKTIRGNDGGFEVRGGDKICFFDRGGDDCNVFVRIKNRPLPLPDPNNAIISSLDLNATGFTNVVWHTRMATGYGQTNVLQFE